jgi:hypothetical protein
MRLSRSAHTSQPWRIHEIAPDFRLEDVWALPTPGGPDDFAALVRLVAAMDPARRGSGATRALFAIRFKLGELLGWDGEGEGIGSRVPTLRDRVPPELCDGPAGPDPAQSLFTPLYLTDDEWALEIANHTMHGILHLGWVPDGSAGFRGQMAVLVKPNGLLGRAYMGAILPFRYLIVYPSMMHGLKRAWRKPLRASPPVGATHGA